MSDTKLDWVCIGQFEWKNGKFILKKKDDNNKMKVLNSTGQEVTIKQLGPHDAQETLGVMQVPD